MRLVSAETPCQLSAEELWALRLDFGFDDYLATCDGKSAEVVHEEEVGDIITRTVKLCFPAGVNPVPLPLRRVLGPDDVVPLVTCTWHKTLFDKQNACKIRVEMPSLGERISIIG